ncbi:MAG: transglutaminase family protein [Treponema sp.]|nr:transglutaminase family protein [Treponema sp.]
MKTLSVDYKMHLAFSGAVSDHFFILRCVPVSRGCQTVTSRSLSLTPDVPLSASRDTFGNSVYRGQYYAPHTEFAFHVRATVLVHSADGSREPCPPFYRYPTRLTACTDGMRSFLRGAVRGTDFERAVAERKFAQTEIHAFSDLLCRAVNGRICYTSGETTVKTTAAEAFCLQKGVCQDYAHLFVSLAREAGIAARYVCGMSAGEGATHAWAEYFVPDDDGSGGDGRSVQGAWFGTDPTRARRVDDDYVILAVGRDFSDSQIDRGVFCGAVSQTQTVLVKTRELPAQGGIGEYSGHSVSGTADMAGQQ